jgi:hypothetical protein
MHQSRFPRFDHPYNIWRSQIISDGDCRAIGGMKIGRGNRNTRRKTCPSATLSTTNPTWPDPGSNPGCRGEKPATNRLSYGNWDIDSLIVHRPATVAERSMACTTFARSEAGIVSSNPTQGMDVCYAYMFILCLCCPVFRWRPCDEVITCSRSPTVCKMIKIKQPRHH